MIDQQEYFRSVYSTFQQAESRGDGFCERFFRFAGKWTVCIRLSSPELLPQFTRAFSHLADAPVSHPDLTIWVADKRTGNGCAAPFPPSEHREIVWQLSLLNRDGVKGALRLFPSRLALLNLRENIALYWINDLSELPWYEIASPFRDILYWWMAEKEHQAVHAAAVGLQGSGVLLVGEGGAGKSTTSLSLVEGGFSYVSDDFCLIGNEDAQLYAYSLFNTAKIDTIRGRVSLPSLESCISNPDRAETEKGVMFLQEHFPERVVGSLAIRAIVAPRITGLADTLLKPMNAREGVKAFVQSTLGCLPGNNVDDFYRLIRLTKNIPCYRLEVGTDLSRVPVVVQEVLNAIPAAAVSSKRIADRAKAAGEEEHTSPACGGTGEVPLL